jgi:hypothetical protein
MAEVFLGREALSDGLSRHDLRRWYRPVFRGVYAPKHAPLTVADRALGAWLTTDRAGVIAGVAASALHRSRWVGDDEPIEVLIGERRRQSGLIIRMDRFNEDEFTEVGDLPVTTPARTAFDLGRHLKRSEALARLDALMRAAPFRIEEVEELMQRYGPVRGVRQLRDLMPLVDAGAESPKESWLRLLLIDAGLPSPETQIPVCDEVGVPIAYLDMGYRDIKLAFEYDGDQHRSDRRQYVKDIRRIPMVERRGWEVIRVIAEDRPAQVLLRAREAYTRRGGGEIDEMARFTRTFAA